MATPSPLRQKLILLMLLPSSILCWSFADDFFKISKQIDVFASVYREVNQYYVDEVNPGELMKTALDGMLKSLDPFTNYYPESEIEDYRLKHVSTEYGGIGATSLRRNDSIFIYDVYEGFPAQKAGLMAGDLLLAVNGRNIKGLNPEEVDELVKGQAGTVVRMSVARFGQAQPLDISITRGEIKVKNVPFYGMINDSTGYIRLDKFLQECYSEVRAALIDLKKNPGINALVFDLRGNGGGLLEESVQILNLFTEKGELLVTQKGKTSGSNNTYTAKNDPVDTKIRLAILIDKNSASASEITAGTLQDIDRAVVIGQRSFGKGLVQQTRPLTYNAQMKLTVAKYFTASGRCVQTRIYHHGEEDQGSVSEVPDSLLKPFRTKNGRTVYDGSAVFPDRYVAPGDTSNIAKSLIRNFLIFDYATQYRLKNNAIDSASLYRFSAGDYEQFMIFLRTRQYAYATQTEEAFSALKETAIREKYYSGFSQQIDALGKQLNHDKEEDLRLFRSEISAFMEREIVSRYYYQQGRFKYLFANDPVIAEALRVLGNPALYTSILKGEGEYKVIGKPRSAK